MLLRTFQELEPQQSCLKLVRTSPFSPPHGPLRPLDRLTAARFVGSGATCSTWWTGSVTALRSRQRCLPGTSWTRALFGISTNYVVVVPAPRLNSLLEWGGNVMVPSWFLSPEGGRDPFRDYNDIQVFSATNYDFLFKEGGFLLPFAEA